MSNFYANSAERRQRKFEKQGGLCYWCKSAMTLEFGQPKANGNPGLPRNFATFEHLQRKRDGGAGKPHNVVLACLKCNNGREHGKQTSRPKRENVIARKRSSQELINALSTGTLTDAERGELFSRGILPNWPMWSKLMARIPPGNP